jgi:hypothetical protein
MCILDLLNCVNGWGLLDIERKEVRAGKGYRDAQLESAQQQE